MKDLSIVKITEKDKYDLSEFKKHKIIVPINKKNSYILAIKNKDNEILSLCEIEEDLKSKNVYIKNINIKKLLKREDILVSFIQTIKTLYINRNVTLKTSNTSLENICKKIGFEKKQEGVFTSKSLYSFL